MAHALCIDEALWYYMEEKNTRYNRQLHKLYPKRITIPEYFKYEDYSDIISWSKKSKIEVLNKLIHNFKTYACEMYVFSFLTCPFCLKFNVTKVSDDCSKCGYGKRHGKCSTDVMNDNEILYKLLKGNQVFDKKFFEKWSKEFKKSLEQEKKYYGRID